MHDANVIEDLQTVLDELVEDAERSGVELEIHQTESEEDGEPVIWLASIRRESSVRGSGARALEQLLEIGSEYGFRIEGQIDSPLSRLARYYRDQGFDIEIRDERTVITRHP